MKTCTKCGEAKPLSEFYVLKVGHSGRVNPGYFPSCKDCEKARATAWTRQFAEDNPEEMAARRARYSRKRKLRDKYGITLEEYDALLIEQGGRCAICGTDDPGRGSEFFPVDHDHATGERRGLLCHDCNLGIAHFGDDPDRLLAAAAYLLARQDVLGIVF